MYKLITYAGYDARTGPHIFPIEADLDRSISHIKMASELPPAIEQYMRAAVPIKGKTQLLIDAMGSGEYYGSNVNGDYFAEQALNHPGPEYGYETFQHYAYPFKHHVNKDPARAYGDRVTLSSYNPAMHRVLLIVRVDDSKCQDILGDLAANRYWDVSMGCFMAGALVTMADGARKPIEQIVIGDEVVTHLGRVRRVTETHRRAYKGEIYSIRPEAGETIRCTHQHPFLAVAHDDVKTAGPKDGHRAWRDSFKRPPDWVHAECLDESSHILAPIPQVFADLNNGGTRAMARLLGYYLSEGHVLRNKKKEPCGIELTTHEDDAIHAEIADLCVALGAANEPACFRRSNSDVAVGISIFDKSIAEFCIGGAGQYSKTKRLSREVMEWDSEAIRHLIGAYANGDGCGSEDGTLKLSTSSEALAWQLQFLLLRIKIPASVNRLDHGPSRIVDTCTTEFVVHIGKQWAQALRPYCAKIKPAEVFKTKNSRRIIDGYLVTPIREISAMYVETEVFNFEVEEDNSYLIDGMAVHNCRVPYDRCSICDNRAKNRAEYCPHLRYQMNKILPDGRRVFAYNDKPKFFDISFVTIGAEKASHVLKKVAHEGVVYDIRPSSAELGESFYAKYAAAEKASSASKTADMTKEVPAGETKIEGVTPSDQAKVDSFMEDAGAVKSTEPALPPALLNQLTGFPLREVFATLAALGIDLRPQEFQRIILVKQGAGALADKLAAHRMVFDEHQPGPMPKWARELEHLSEHDVSEKVAWQLRPYIADRSCYPEILAARLERMEKRGEVPGYNRDSQWYPMTDEQKRVSSGMPGVVPASLALAAGFMVFRKAFPQLVEKAPSPVRAIAKHPWMLPLLISAGVGATVAAQQLGASRDLEPHGTGAGLDAKNGPAYHQRKTAGITGLIPLAYIHAGVQQQRSKSGSRGGFERLASAATPRDRAIHHLTKFGGLMSDPALDASILESVQRLARRMKEN